MSTPALPVRRHQTDNRMNTYQCSSLYDHAPVCDVPQHSSEHDATVIACDPRSLHLLQLAHRVAASEATVMISGESGTGKEVIARYIHRASPRARQPFVAINCAAIPESMLEALLFGFEKGAFTGAFTARAGKFEQANGGTLLLDEISEMDLNLQAKLLRVIQEHEVERLGSHSPLALDLRLLATTNRDLAQEVAAGRFREDLYYRLNVFPLQLPPLRSRTGDILPLARRFLAGQRPGHTPQLTEAACRLLYAHPWRGNVRELENVMQRALILCSGPLIEAEHLVFEAAPAPAARSHSDQLGSAADCDLKSHEKAIIMDAITSNHSRKLAAEKLGISPRTLRYKLARFRQAALAQPA